MAAKSVSDESVQTTRPGEIKWPILNRPRILSEDRDVDELKRIDLHMVEVCHWLKQLLGIEISHENFMDKLNTGRELCELQNKLISLLGGEMIKYNADAEENSQHAHENIKHFVNWCKELRCHQLFESSDLADQKSELNEKNERRKRVVVCLHQVKQKYDRALRNNKEAKVYEDKEHEKAADESDSSNPISKIQVTGKPERNDLTKQPDLLLVQENDDEPNDKDEPMDVNKPNNNDKLKEQKDDSKPKELKHEDEPKDKDKLEVVDKPEDADEAEVASSSEDFVFDTDNETKVSPTISVSNEPSEGDVVKEKGKSETKSALKVSVPSTPQEPLQQSLPKLVTSKSNQQSNKDANHQATPLPDYRALFLCISISLLSLGVVYLLKRRK